MKLKRFNIIFLFLLSIGFTGCKKYLDEKRDKQLVTPTTLDDLQAILDNNDRLNQRVTPGFGETSSDDYFLTPSIYSSVGVPDQQAYTWTLKTYVYQNDWSIAYTPVYYANLTLEQVEKIERNNQNEAKWNNVKGSAYFFRAYFFLQLIWEYGKAYDEQASATDPGIVLRLSSDFNQLSVRASVKDSYERIIADLNQSASYLPDHPLHPLRPSKAAAYGLLARTYLSMRMYDSAYKYADRCLQIKNDLLNYNNAADITATSLNPFKPYHKETIFFTTQTGTHSPKNPARATIDTSLFASYENNDIRKTAFFRSLNGYFGFKGTYSGAFLFLFTGLAVDEIYLIRAETNARAGRVGEAMKDLNTLLVKRYNSTFVPRIAGSPQEAIAIILSERRKELLMRGLRWIDIKRLNKEGAGIIPKRVVGSQVYSLSTNEDRYALPLPSDIIELTGLPQNPGW